MRSLPVLRALVTSFILSGHVLAVILSDPSQLTATRYDYIIIGAGTAGLVLANRLTEDANITVLVLEAGVSDQNVIPVMAPFLGPSVTPNTPWDWNYTTVAQPGLGNRSYSYPRGRLLGGSSSANYLVHQYGTNEEWDRVAELSGDSGWSWSNMSQYVAKHESLVFPASGRNVSGEFIPSLHPTTGTLPISLPNLDQAVDPRIMATTEQLAEFPYSEDNSGINNNMLGIGWVQSAMNNSARASSSTSYLAKANGRPNLTVLINAMVSKLLPTSNTISNATSFLKVQFSDARTFSTTPSFTVAANKEVILSAGAVGTPQILQLSGIGSPEDLDPFDIPVLVNSPQVGHNMQDHPLLPNIFNVSGNLSFDSILRDPVQYQAAITQWETDRSGFIGNNVINHIGFARLNDTVLSQFTSIDPSAGPTTPHYEFIFANFFWNPISPPIPATGSYFTILTALVTPSSRGYIKINSTNPFVAPLINPNMLDTDFDITTIVESVKAVKRFASAPAWSDYITGTVGTLSGTTDAELEEHARSKSTTVFHPSSTASISSGTVEDGVVNADLTVKGVSGLRVVDLSVLPFVPSCHPQGLVYLLAERAAVLIKSAA